MRDHGGVPLDHTFDPLAALRRPDEPSLAVFVWGTVFLDMIFAVLPHAPKPGTEVWADGLASCPGGIANLAVATRRLGLRTGLAAAFSDDDYGDFCWRTLEEQEGIDLARSRRFADWHSPVTVSMSVDRDRSMVSHGHPSPVPASELIGTPPRSRAVMVDLGEDELWGATGPTSAGTPRSSGRRTCSSAWTGATSSCRMPSRPWPTPAPARPPRPSTPWRTGCPSRSSPTAPPELSASTPAPGRRHASPRCASGRSTRPVQATCSAPRCSSAPSRSGHSSSG